MGKQWKAIIYLFYDSKIMRVSLQIKKGKKLELDEIIFGWDKKAGNRLVLRIFRIQI